MEHTSTKKSAFPTFVGGIVLFALFGGMVLLTLKLAGKLEDQDYKRAVERKEILQKLQSDHQTTLTTYGWADKSRGMVRIPVERATELALPELKAKAIRPLEPIDPITSAGATGSPAPVYFPQPKVEAVVPAVPAAQAPVKIN
jgi:hypothetical protein